MMRWFTWVVAVVACSSTAPAPQVVPPPPPPPPPPNASSCPASFSTAGGACTPDPTANATCNYAEGSCYCGITPVCSGAARDPDEELREPTFWQCTAKPPLVRADGCPGSEPSGRCTQNGKKCTYGSCCVSHYSCTSGTWQMTGGECPP